MTLHTLGADREILLLKLMTVEPLIKSLEERLSQVGLDLVKATALHPFDPAEQALFLSRAEIRPGEFTPSHSLIDPDLEQAARCLGDEFSENKRRVSKEFCDLHLTVEVLNRQGAGPEAMGPFLVAFLRAAAALVRIGLQPALFLRGQLLDRLKHYEPVNLPCELPVPGAQDRTCETTNVFRRDGTDWSVRYRHSKLFSVRFNAGSTYIHYLLERPRQAVQVAELAAQWDRIQTPVRRPTAAGKVGANSSGDDGPVLDATGLRQVWERLNCIRAELEEAENIGDTVSMDKLNAERLFLTQALSSATRPDGKRVLLGNQDRKLTDKVTRAIRRAIEVIGKKDAALGNHLDKAITTGTVCVYEPEISTPWEL